MIPSFLGGSELIERPPLFSLGHLLLDFFELRIGLRNVGESVGLLGHLLETIVVLVLRMRVLLVVVSLWVWLDKGSCAKLVLGWSRVSSKVLISPVVVRLVVWRVLDG